MLSSVNSKVFYLQSSGCLTLPYRQFVPSFCLNRILAFQACDRDLTSRSAERMSYQDQDVRFDTYSVPDYTTFDPHAASVRVKLSKY